MRSGGSKVGSDDAHDGFLYAAGTLISATVCVIFYDAGKSLATRKTNDLLDDCRWKVSELRDENMRLRREHDQWRKLRKGEITPEVHALLDELRKERQW